MFKTSFINDSLTVIWDTLPIIFVSCNSSQLLPFVLILTLLYSAIFTPCFILFFSYNFTSKFSHVHAVLILWILAMVSAKCCTCKVLIISNYCDDSDCNNGKMIAKMLVMMLMTSLMMMMMMIMMITMAMTLMITLMTGTEQLC